MALPALSMLAAMLTPTRTAQLLPAQVSTGVPVLAAVDHRVVSSAAGVGGDPRREVTKDSRPAPGLRGGLPPRLPGSETGDADDGKGAAVKHLLPARPAHFELPLHPDSISVAPTSSRPPGCSSDVAGSDPPTTSSALVEA